MSEPEFIALGQVEGVQFDDSIQAFPYLPKVVCVELQLETWSLHLDQFICSVHFGPCWRN
jgi:hypothetical protein